MTNNLAKEIIANNSLFPWPAGQPVPNIPIKKTQENNNLTTQKILLGDCIKLLRDIKTESIDLIATDPPYEINFEKNTWDADNSLDWHLLTAEFNRVLRKHGTLIVFQGWSNVIRTNEIISKEFTLKNWIIYDRIKGRGAKTNLVSTREDILWYVKDEENYTYNKISSTIKKKTGGTIGNRNGNPYRALSNVWTDISPLVPWSKERVQHPTQKPIQLMNRIINIFSNPGDIILDPFAGSGTTAVSSLINNRNYICIEKEEKYYAIMKKRIQEILL